jgi:hypothetical protein
LSDGYFYIQTLDPGEAEMRVLACSALATALGLKISVPEKKRMLCMNDMCSLFIYIFFCYQARSKRKVLRFFLDTIAVGEMPNWDCCKGLRQENQDFYY